MARFKFLCNTILAKWSPGRKFPSNDSLGKRVCNSFCSRLVSRHNHRLSLIDASPNCYSSESPYRWQLIIYDFGLSTEIRTYIGDFRIMKDDLTSVSPAPVI